MWAFPFASIRMSRSCGETISDEQEGEPGGGFSPLRVGSGFTARATHLAGLRRAAARGRRSGSIRERRGRGGWWGGDRRRRGRGGPRRRGAQGGRQRRGRLDRSGGR